MKDLLGVRYKLAVTSRSSCIGCRNIANNSFPFAKDEYGRLYIDVESCGEVEKSIDGIELDGFYVNHCPVCGKYLYEK